ncbi:hypothetical protein GCM10009846_04070 [Agrococcus versicolor]|uniref:Peptidase S11 D-alanyl-D-alanine carboxypeptidase A N-terminal domain-containing protein n=1 Tax=Agrococcus versicolor TaxID=501482 RepID=A0ABN3AJT2_9MICO
MRRRRGIALALASATAALLVAGVAGGHVVATATPPDVEGTTSSLVATTGTPDVAWPVGVGASAFSVPQLAGAEGADGATAPLPIASIAKLVCALLVLERFPLADGDSGPSIMLTAPDVAALGEMRALAASTLPIADGDVVTQRQLLEASMLVSAGNASMSLAHWAFGSQEAYVAEATRWLQEEGLEGITVVDASGIGAGNVATPAALLGLMARVDASPVLRAITGMTQTDLPRLGLVSNTNGALGIAGIDSGKTGSLDESGRTVLVGATVVVGGVDVRIHAALLGVPREVDRDAAIAGLVASVAANLRITDLVAEGAPVATYAGPWGERVLLHARESASLLLWPGQAVELRVTVPPDLAVGEEAAGWIDVVAAGETIRVPVGTRDTLAGPDLGWRLDHAPEVLGWAIGGRR